MNKERREKAIAWLKEEIRSLELAPELNGCPMTQGWAEQLEIMRTCLEAVSAYYHDNISIDEAVESAQETLQRAMAEYKARAEKAERERDAAIKELNGVASAVDDLSDFIDEQIYPLVQYDMYLALRENADSISMWQYESEWRGQKEE